MKAILPFINLLLLFIIIKCDTEDQKYYFQFYPSQDKDKPYLLYAYTPPSNLITINTTETDNCTIIDNTKISESAIKNLSSVIIYNNDLVIKTCFNPNILVEIKNATTNKMNSKSLSNVKYCYSTAIYSPKIKNNQDEYAIITYWIEYELTNGKENYTHKCMLYDIKNQEFTEEIILKTTENFYSEKCINLRNTDIFCIINSEQQTTMTYFIIKTERLFENDNNHLVFSNIAYEKDVYRKKIFSTNLGLYYSKMENYYDIFLNGYHNKKDNITKLNFQLYEKRENRIKNFKYDNLLLPELIVEKYYYIEPDLFNMIFQKTNDTIISYIMKVKNDTNLVLSRFNLTKSIELKNSSQLVSHVLKDDICSNPKYMQTNLVTSFINYNQNDKSIINKYGEENYYKYQKDIVSLIACLNEDNKVEYEPKKIVLPQCLNILDELNNKSYHVIEFTPNKSRIEFDIYGDPKFVSLRNHSMQFYPGETEGNVVINYLKKGSKNYTSYGEKDFNKTLKNFTHISFTKTSNMIENKALTLKYRLMETSISEDNNTYTCHLSSDICELKFIFIKNSSVESNGTDLVTECQYENIEGIILNKCICDVERGFKEEPDGMPKRCVCKEGYSYDKDIKKCLPNTYLPKSLCFNESNIDKNLWFKMKEYKFYYAKINDCVYIFDGQNLTLFFYSNREDCSFESETMIQFIQKCLNKPEITGVKEYMDFLDSAKEYDPNATKVTIFKKIEKKDSKIKTIFFNLVNGQSQENVSDVILPSKIISEIKNISNISKELNLLVFKADMTRNDTVSTQVEYQFYNPIPSKIHQKIIFTKRLNNTNLRRLDVDDDEIRINITTDDFKVKLHLPIQWSDDELDIIEELYKQKHIFIFDSSNTFYLDVCYNFTTKYNSDIYLQDRKERYYINHPFCEEGCKLIDDQNYDSNKLTCQCSFKIVNDNYTNTSFYEEEPGEEFNKTFLFPNVKIVGCSYIIKFFRTSIDIFNLVLFGVFFLTHLIRILCYKNNKLISELNLKINTFLKKYEKDKDKDDKKTDEIQYKIEKDERIIKREKTKEENRIKAYDDDNEDNFEIIEEEDEKEDKVRERDEKIPLKKDKKEDSIKKNIFSSQYKEEDDMIYSNNNNNSKLISENNPDEMREELSNNDQTQNSSERGKFNKGGVILQYEDDTKDNCKSYRTIYLNRILDRMRYKKAKIYDNRTFCGRFLGMISNNCTIFFILNIQNLFEGNIENKKEKEKETEKETEKATQIEKGTEKGSEIEENKIITINVENKNKKKNENKNKKKKKKKKKKNIKNKKENEKENKNENKNKTNIRPKDGNDLFTRISVLILTICLYIFINILIMTKGYSLHLYLRKDKGKFDFLSFLTNLFVPYLIFYISILRLKRTLSIKEFLDDNYYQYYHILCEFYRKGNINTARLRFHNIESKISKKKNEHQRGMKRIFIGGSILILLNWYYMSCFLGIYENSYDCLALNIAISILSSIFVSLLVYLISASFRTCALKENKNKNKDKNKNKEKPKKNCIKKLSNKFLFFISELFNPQYKFFFFCCCCKACFSCFLFDALAKICSILCCCCFNEDNFEDYKEEIKYEEQRKRNKRKKKEKKNKEKNKKQKTKEPNEKEIIPNLIENDEDDKKTYDTKEEKKSESDKTSVFTYKDKKK